MKSTVYVYNEYLIPDCKIMVSDCDLCDHFFELNVVNKSKDWVKDNGITITNCSFTSSVNSDKLTFFTSSKQELELSYPDDIEIITQNFFDKYLLSFIPIRITEGNKFNGINYSSNLSSFGELNHQ